jgi:two-component system response regulator YesN
MTVVAEAEDGAMALELAERERPDILLIDIRMPIMNGLELIERIAAVRRDCVIIVVSGHDEFEYAKKALQLKVFEYLLKPVSRDALAAVLARAAAELAGTRRQDLYLAWAREQLAKNMPLLREVIPAAARDYGVSFVILSHGLIRAADVTGMTSLVRVSKNDPAIIPPGCINSPRSVSHSRRRRNASRRNRLSRMESRTLMVCIIS